eukprot:scaffold19679_cov124-Isochrysis_galbana.AAC.4
MPPGYSRPMQRHCRGSAPPAPPFGAHLQHHGCQKGGKTEEPNGQVARGGGDGGGGRGADRAEGGGAEQSEHGGEEDPAHHGAPGERKGVAYVVGGVCACKWTVLE